MRLASWLLCVLGFGSKYALVPIGEWARIQALVYKSNENVEGLLNNKYLQDFLEELKAGSLAGEKLAMCGPETFKELEQLSRTRRLAEEAHVCAVGALPVSAVQASKVAGEVVVAGLPEDPDPSKYMTNKS